MYLHEFTVPCFITGWIKIIFTCLCNHTKTCYCRNAIVHLSLRKARLGCIQPSQLDCITICYICLFRLAIVFCETNLAMNVSGCQHLRGHLRPYVKKLGHLNHQNHLVLSDDSLLKVNDDPISQFIITALEQFSTIVLEVLFWYITQR